MMGSNNKKHKERESRKRRHRSRSPYEENYESSHKERRHKHHRRHKDRKKDKVPKYDVSDDSDVVEIIDDSPKRDESRKTSHADNKESNKSSDSLSIDETNKLRAKLGLKPLEVESTSTRSKDSKQDKIKDDWGEFYHKPAENWAEKAEQEKLRAKLTEHKEKRKLEEKLSKTKALGESDSEDDASAWVNKSRKIENEKKVAEKRAKMLEELDAQFGVSDIIDSEEREQRRKKYSAKDLKGLRVDHDIDNIAEERDVILTLKDQGVLENDEEVLVNVNILDNERYKKNVENKKHKQRYNAYDVEEFDEFGNPKEKSLLSKYDEEIEGEKRESFRIGIDSHIERKQAVAQSIKEKLAKKTLESIGETVLKVGSEYYNEEELLKFKKPKKKIRKIRQKGKLLSAEELQQITNNKGIEDVGSRRPKIKADIDIDDIPNVDVKLDDIKLEDEKDDILEKALHKARKIKQKENVAAEIINEIKTEIKEEPLDNGSIVLNATAEFCRTLGDIPTYGKSGNREEAEDLEMDYENDIKDDDPDVEIIEPSGWNAIDPNEIQSSSETLPQDTQILDEEPDVSRGVGAALKVAMSKGYLDKEMNHRPSNSKLAHLQAQHYSIEDKVYGEDGERGGGRRERYSGPITEFREKDGFKPNVKLEYIDDEGHVLNSKEAFRYLSHKFHGKGPGKNKIEKRIKKGVQEQLMKKMNSTDTPLGTLNMLQAKQKETQSPFIVLSGSKQGQSTVISKTGRR